MSNSISCLSAAPVISLNSLPIVFSLDTNRVSKPVPYSVSTVCSNSSSTPTCSLVILNPGLITWDTSNIYFAENTPLGIYSATLTCTQNSLVSTAFFDFSVVYANSANFQFAPLSSTPVVILDCIDTVVTPQTVHYVDNSLLTGVTSSMVTISNSVGASKFGDFLLLPSGTSAGYSLQFSQANIEQGQVLVRPSLITNILSSRSVAIPISAIDPSGNTLSSNALFSVQFAYCPYLPSNPSATLYTTSSTNPIPITSSVISLSEPHALSVWDVQWLVSAPISKGKLEYYCPDTLCAGPGWIRLNLPATIKQSWIQMNALRWNPSGTTAGETAQYTFVAQTTYPKYSISSPMTFTLRLTNDSTQTGPASVPLPYYTSNTSCTYKLLGPSGSKPIAATSFGPFIADSPIRPVCFIVTTNSNGVQFEDFTIASTYSNTEITINGAVMISSDLALPVGFIPINFTRTNSMTGQFYQALQITSKPASFSNSITLTLPQTTLGSNAYVKSTISISVLRFDGSSGQLSHIAPTSWNQDSSTSPLVMQITLPTDGYYIFGYMDMTAGNIVPVASNVWVPYLKEYGKMITQVDKKPFILEFLASKSTQFSVMKPYETVWDTDGFQLLDTYYLTGAYPADNSLVLNMTLNYGCDNDSVVNWALQQFNQNLTTGMFWNMSTANSTIYQSPSCTLSVNTSTPGMWGVLKNVPFVSASNAALETSQNPYLLVLVCIAAAVIRL